MSPKPMAALLRDLVTAVTRRLRRGAESRPVLAAALLISAVAALFAFSAPQPLAYFVASPSATVVTDSFSPAGVAVIPPAIAPFSSLDATISSFTAPPPFPAPPPPPLLFPPPTPVATTSSTGSPPPAGPPLVSAEMEGVTSSGGAEFSPPHREVSISLTPRDRELLYAKREIDRAPIVLNDPELYAPLFRNVSIFKRSYELMEKTLKVYVYRDGARPIFHQPDLKGIYASEGWFMKLMEDSKKFVVKDPNRAHLFYIPYGARELELALYVPNSHNLNPLLLYMKNYVDKISAKYPFWNRTRGSDHFLVACHDWGPYTTRLHEELRTNTIKALCNADVSEGIFVRGKDVSLPETSIRNPRRPYRDIGGKPVSQRSILAFFAGNMHGRVRPILLQYWKGKDDDMKIYGPLPSRVARKMSYAQHMKSSKFCICPMGYEVNSPRIVEAIDYECVPVIIADNFVPPFDEVLDWSAFSLTVAEKDIPELKNILTGISVRRYVSMQTNVKRLQKHFLWHARPVSPRIVEAIDYECVPVIIADNFVPPFDEVLDWSAFSLTVAEKDIPELKNILTGISVRRYVSMQRNVKRLQKHFLWHARPVKYDIFHMILHSIWFNRLNQMQAEL